MTETEKEKVQESMKDKERVMQKKRISKGGIDKERERERKCERAIDKQRERER